MRILRRYSKRRQDFDRRRSPAMKAMASFSSRVRSAGTARVVAGSRTSGSDWLVHIAFDDQASSTAASRFAHCGAEFTTKSVEHVRPKSARGVWPCESAIATRSVFDRQSYRLTIA